MDRPRDWKRSTHPSNGNSKNSPWNYHQQAGQQLLQLSLSRELVILLQAVLIKPICNHSFKQKARKKVSNEKCPLLESSLASNVSVRTKHKYKWMNKSGNRLQFQMTTIINYQKKLTREKVTVPKVGKKKKTTKRQPLEQSNQKTSCFSRRNVWLAHHSGQLRDKRWDE